MPEEYVMHVGAYPALVIGTPHRIEIPGLRRWFEYTSDTDCDLEDWEDRANSEWQPRRD